MPGLTLSCQAVQRVDLTQSPFSEYFGKPLSRNEKASPDVAVNVRAFISNLEAEIDRFDVEVAQVQQVLDQRGKHQLGKHRTKCAKFLDKHKELVAPAFKLPFELWLEIFELVCDAPQEIDLVGSIDEMGPWPLALVCREWRMIVTGAPSLWSCIAISDAKEWTPGTQLMLERILEWSANEPLQINLDTVDLPEETLATFYASASRWMAWSVHGTQLYYETLAESDALHDSLNSLIALTLNTVTGIDDVPTFLPSLYGIYGACAQPLLPSLEELELHIVYDYDRPQDIDSQYLEDDIAQIKYPWSQLRELTIDTGVGVIFKGVPMSNLLKQCANIEELSMKGSYEAHPSGYCVELPLLRVLSFTELNLLPYARVLESIQCPALVEVKIICETIMESGLYDFFDRHKETVTKLKITLFPPSESDSHPQWTFVKVLPNLTHLALRVGYMSESMLALFPLISAGALPKLRKLKLGTSEFIGRWCDGRVAQAIVDSLEPRLRETKDPLLSVSITSNNVLHEPVCGKDALKDAEDKIRSSILVRTLKRLKDQGFMEGYVESGT